MGQQAGQPPIIAAVMRKAAVVWLAPIGGRAVPAWLLWREGSAYVVGGPGEQPLTGIEVGQPALVIATSAEPHYRLVTWVAAVHRIEPQTEQWTQVVPLLVARRLSAAADAEQRWARDGVMLQLIPTGEFTEAGAGLPATNLAVAPEPTPAST